MRFIAIVRLRCAHCKRDHAWHTRGGIHTCNIHLHTHHACNTLVGGGGHIESLRDCVIA